MKPESESNRSDPFRLCRFVTAQQGVYEQALGELRRGRKESHWMWFIFPQLEGLGSSATATRYAIRSMDEARAYLAHAILGARLVECCEAVLGLHGKTASEIFGFPDDLKLKSCMTLFARVAPGDSVFRRVLERYYDGELDQRTIGLLRGED